jgi:hypothetical protein
MTGELIHRSLRDRTLKRQSDAVNITPGTVNFSLTVKRRNPLPSTYPLGPNPAGLNWGDT